MGRPFKSPESQGQSQRKKIIDLLRDILEAIKSGGNKPTFGWVLSAPSPKGETRMPLELTITNEQKQHIKVTPVTATGRPTSLDGPVDVQVSSTTGQVDDPATLFTIDADGKGFTVISPDSPMDVFYLVGGDADLGAGVTRIEDTVTVHVGGAQAVNLGLTVDAAEPK